MVEDHHGVLSIVHWADEQSVVRIETERERPIALPGETEPAEAPVYAGQQAAP